MIDAIVAVGLRSDTPVSGPEGASSSGNTNFAQMLDSHMEQVNQDLSQADTAVRKLASGQPVEIHDVMISLEKARISVQLMLQVRNRVLESFQEISRMQV